MGSTKALQERSIILYSQAYTFYFAVMTLFLLEFDRMTIKLRLSFMTPDRNFAVAIIDTNYIHNSMS